MSKQRTSQSTNNKEKQKSISIVAFGRIRSRIVNKISIRIPM